MAEQTESFGTSDGGQRRRSPWLVTLGVIGLLVLAGLVWAGCRRGGAPSESTPTAAVIGTEAACQRIDATGKILVGTSGDYPPFEYYNDKFRLDGFDIALMTSIAKNLGVTTDIKDYAFDGLSGALQLGEIDAAIAAITITDQRESIVDFSTPYYYGRGSAVALPTSGLVLTSPANFAGLRVGVERGTVYDSWAEQNLVVPGIIPEQNLFRYEKAEHAVGDLQQARLDVVLLDGVVAEQQAASGKVKIVGEGAVAQRYAIAVPQNATCLQRRINQALAALTADGTIDRLAQVYIGASIVPVPTPTPTQGPPAPTPTAAPVACIDSSEYVMDLTYDDKGGTAPPNVQPGESFTKGWRIRNSGTCPWTNKYRLNYVGGNTKAAQMDGQPVYVSGTVAPGQTYDFYVNLNAPSGVYGVMQGRWQMQNPANVLFGQTVYVMVNVVPPTAGPTAPPPPTATAPPAPTGTTPPQPTATQPPTAIPDPLVGMNFGFYAINGQATIPGSVLTLAFGSGGSLSGSDGCNTFQGTYTVQPSGTSQGALTITLGPGTTMACPPEITTQAEVYRNSLGLVRAYYYPPKGLLISLLDQVGVSLLDGQLQ